MALALAVAMTIMYRFSPDFPHKLWLFRLLVLDLGGSVYVVPGPSNMHGHERNYLGKQSS